MRRKILILEALKLIELEEQGLISYDPTKDYAYSGEGWDEHRKRWDIWVLDPTEVVLVYKIWSNNARWYHINLAKGTVFAKKDVLDDGFRIGFNVKHF